MSAPRSRARSRRQPTMIGQSGTRRSGNATASRRGRGGNRGEYLRSSHRRSRGLTRAVLALALVAVVGAGLAIFTMTRPASALVTVTPEDATVVLAGVEASGTVEVEDLEPGLYVMRADRKGFEPLITEVELKRGRRAKLEYALTPLPQEVSVVTHPAGATCSVTCADGTVFDGAAPATYQVPSGPVTISVSLAGYNPFVRKLYLDEPFALDFFLDPEGQILHALGTITTKGAPKGVSVTHDGGEAWTSILNGPPSIQIFDPRTGRSIGEVDIGEHGAVEVIFNRAGTLAYTSQMETAKCFEIDVKTRKVLRDVASGATATFVETDQKPNTIDLTPDGKMLFVSCRGANNPKSYYIPGPEWGSILVFDTSDGTPLDALVAGNQPTALDVSDDGKLLIFSDFLDNRLRAYEIPPYEQFAAGGGGRFEAHKAEIKKK